MKFSIAALLAAVGFAQAKSLKGTKVLNKRKLLQNAVRVDKHGNRLLQQQEEFEITGEYSIQFNHCLSLTTQPDDVDVMFADDTIAYTSNNQIISQTSYVLFNVCKTEYCYYEGEELLYMTDLASYMGSLMEIQSDDKENYCQACQQAQDYCYPEEEEAEEEEQQQEEEQQEDQGEEEQQEEGEEGEEEGEQEEDGGRRLKKQQRRKLNNGVEVEYINCNTCESMKCFEEEEENGYNQNQNQNQIQDEDVLEWVQGMVECDEIENVVWGNYALYGGFMCNEDGDGVEVGVFLDNECQIYTKLSNYQNLVQGTANYQYLYMSSDIVTYPFLNDVDCVQKEYASPEDAENEQDQQDDNGEAPQANEYCQNVMNEGVDIDTCGAYEDDGNNNQQGDDAFNYYDWYTYLVTNDQADDIQEVCTVVQVLEGEYSSAHTYKEDDGEGGGSGHVYDYKSSSSSGADFNAGKVFGIIIAVVVVVVAGIMIMQSCSGKRDSKKVPLVNKSGGAMA